MTSNIQKKNHRIFSILCFFNILLVTAFFAGCEKNEQEQTKQEAKSVMEKTKAQETSPEETKTEVTVEESPLIYAEEPQNENMAGLLQTTGAGVMVQVKAGTALGSGVIWKATEEQLIILTAGHVLTQESGEVKVFFINGYEVSPENIVVDSQQDLAFLAVSIKGISKNELEQYFVVNVEEESFSSAQKGDGIIAMSSVQGVATEAYEGIVLDPWIYVEDFSQHMMLVKVETVPGMSGGGVFDYSGHFLGILCGVDSEGEAAVIPAGVIATRYENLSENF